MLQDEDLEDQDEVVVTCDEVAHSLNLGTAVDWVLYGFSEDNPKESCDVLLEMPFKNFIWQLYLNLVKIYFSCLIIENVSFNEWDLRQ